VLMRARAALFFRVVWDSWGLVGAGECVCWSVASVVWGDWEREPRRRLSPGDRARAPRRRRRRRRRRGGVGVGDSCAIVSASSVRWLRAAPSPRPSGPVDHAPDHQPDASLASVCVNETTASRVCPLALLPLSLTCGARPSPARGPAAGAAAGASWWVCLGVARAVGCVWRARERAQRRRGSSLWLFFCLRVGRRLMSI
jgi:hypothetical protein